MVMKAGQAKTPTDRFHDTPYLSAYKGLLKGVVRWHDLDAVWAQLQRLSDDGWYVYVIGDAPPAAPATQDQFERFLAEIRQLLLEEHKEDYCGIVYADDHEEPGFVKIYDPNNLGMVCGSSEFPPLPGWTLSRVAPDDLVQACPRTCVPARGAAGPGAGRRLRARRTRLSRHRAPLLMRRIAFMLAALLLLGACSSTVRLMPTPTLLTIGDPALPEAGADAGKDTTIEVLYATNRSAVGPQHARRDESRHSNQLRLGVATLQIGGGTKSWEALQAMSTSAVEGERPKITLQGIREMAVLEDGAQAPGPDAQAFFAHVDALLGRGANQDLLIYVHGANTNFERAAAQAAQFQHFLGRDAVVMLFAWPSAGTLLRYRRDMATARRSPPEFAHLLEQLSGHTQAAHLNVLAYSAGAMIASPGLARAAGDATAASVRLGEVYYAAPDIDFPVFVDNLPRYQDDARRVTVAVNLSDRALSFAQWFHRVSRAGRPNLDDIDAEQTRWLVAASGRQELDVLSIRPEDLPGLPASSHSFWYDHPWVSSDVLLKLSFHATPAARGLGHNSNDIDLAFWTFPSDYAEHLPAVMEDLAAGTAVSTVTD